MKIKNIKKLTIKRSLWGRGKTSPRRLKGSNDFGEQKMCCLGFYSKARGATDEDMKGCACPHANPINIEVPESAGLPDGWWHFVRVNDAIRHHSRERTITRLFKKIGIDCKFVD